MGEGRRHASRDAPSPIRHDCSDGRVGCHIRATLRPPIGGFKIKEKWAHNGPFELSAGHREHRERVRSLNLRQFEPPKTFPGLKNVKNVSKKLRDAVS